MRVAARTSVCLGAAAMAQLAHAAEPVTGLHAQPDPAILRLAQAEPARESAAALRKVITDLQQIGRAHV